MIVPDTRNARPKLAVQHHARRGLASAQLGGFQIAWKIRVNLCNSKIKDVPKQIG